MTIRVSEAIDSDTAITVTILRYSGGFVDGIYNIDSNVISFKCLASPQTPTPEELQKLDAGERGRLVKKFICNKNVRTADDKLDHPADVVVENGIKYKVISAADWGLYGYSRVFAAKMEAKYQ